MNSRKVILELLNEIDKGKYVNNVLKVVQTYEIDPRDRNLISKIVYGVVENKLYLDYYIRKFSSVRLKKIEPSILNVLRMSAYQLMFLSKIPHSAVVNEAVKLTKKINFRTSGFVNGLLRNMSRDYKSVKLPAELIANLSVKYSHPEWMVTYFLELFGKDFTISLLAANNETPKMVVRTNTRLINREDLMTKLTQLEYVCEISDIVKEGIVISKMSDISIEENSLFKKGYFTIQDESSMCIAGIVDPQKGERILDLCAAPGGKTTHMATLMDNTGQVVACDLSERKLPLISETCQRLKLDNVDLLQNDARVYNENFMSSFDKVLVDAPCSGLGIIRRKPDIKYLKSLEDIQALTEIQDDILEQASKYVKIGGTLIYSTCTVEPIENEERIQKFLKGQNYEIVQIDENDYLQLYPNVNETDGFFCCKMRKLGE